MSYYSTAKYSVRLGPPGFRRSKDSFPTQGPNYSLRALGEAWSSEPLYCTTRWPCNPSNNEDSRPVGGGPQGRCVRDGCPGDWRGTLTRHRKIAIHTIRIVRLLFLGNLGVELPLCQAPEPMYSVTYSSTTLTHLLRLRTSTGLTSCMGLDFSWFPRRGNGLILVSFCGYWICPHQSARPAIH